MDIPSPLKRVLGPIVEQLERRLDGVVEKRVGVVPGFMRCGIVKAVDRDAVNTEGLLFGMDAVEPSERRWISPDYMPPQDMLDAIWDEIAANDNDDAVEARLLEAVEAYGGRIR